MDRKGGQWVRIISFTPTGTNTLPLLKTTNIQHVQPAHTVSAWLCSSRSACIVSEAGEWGSSPSLGPLTVTAANRHARGSRGSEGTKLELGMSGWFFWGLVRDECKLTGVGCGGWIGLTILDSGGYCVRGSHGCLSGIQVGLLLELPDVFFVADPLVAEPVGYLRERRKEKERGEKRGGVSDVNADKALCTEQSDCFKMSCLGPSSPQSPVSHSNIRWACRLIKRLSDRACALLRMEAWHALCLSLDKTNTQGAARLVAKFGSVLCLWNQVARAKREGGIFSCKVNRDLTEKSLFSSLASFNKWIHPQ